MQRHVLSSLLTWRVASSAALLFVGKNLWLHRHIRPSFGVNSENQAPQDYPVIQGAKRNVVLFETTTTTDDLLTKSQQARFENVRTRKTPADVYFSKNRGRLPLPKVMHKVLSNKDDELDKDSRNTTTKAGNNILVIGDVHGCFEELQLLHQKAVKANNDTGFRFVILVGDMSNKGPYSAQVIRHVRKQPNWLAVRGNHDNAALGAALGHVNRRKNPKYDWVKEGENKTIAKVGESSDRVVLSDKDVMWLSELPYTITIPASMFGKDDTLDTVVVHAGFIPGVGVEEQEIANMIHLREVMEVYSTTSDGDNSATMAQQTRYAQYRKGRIAPPSTSTVDGEQQGEPLPLPWAAVWKGPKRVIFGHDAKRGFQRYGGDWAIGLDTGACYGNQLTGIILPAKQIVSVDAVAEHVPIAKPKTTK